MSSAIALTNLTPSFTLTGLPGDTITDNGAVSMTVLTNNATGYNVTVQSESATLNGPGSNTIPISDLLVNDSFGGGTAGFTALSNTSPVTVFTQSSPSSNTGDTVTNDYRVAIPNVATGTYSATLDYVASTNP